MAYATATGAGGAKRADSADAPPSGVMFMLRKRKQQCKLRLNKEQNNKTLNKIQQTT
jgi:hypothetical protein